MQIFVKTHGKTLALDAHGSDTIKSIKQKIQCMKGQGGALRQRLVHGGKQLADDRLLSDYKIGNEATLHMMGRIKGGGPGISAAQTYIQEGNIGYAQSTLHATHSNSDEILVQAAADMTQQTVEAVVEQVEEHGLHEVLEQTHQQHAVAIAQTNYDCSSCGLNEGGEYMCNICKDCDCDDLMGCDTSCQNCENFRPSHECKFFNEQSCDNCGPDYRRTVVFPATTTDGTNYDGYEGSDSYDGYDGYDGDEPPPTTSSNQDEDYEWSYRQIGLLLCMFCCCLLFCVFMLLASSGFFSAHQVAPI